jgi:hypothetical protein
LLPEDAARLEAVRTQWQRLDQSGQTSNINRAAINPRTATIENLPATSSLYLPKVGSKPTMSEEETREALRRFINEWQGLIGADPAQLSLLENVDKAGSKFARYEQHPFRFPLRGGYGSLQISYTADRRVIGFSSTCIPNTDRLQPAISTMSPQFGWAEAASRIASLPAPYRSDQVQQGTYQLSQANQPVVRELVIYVKESSADQGLVFHLAWEIEVSNAPFKLVYLDAVNGEILVTSQ